MTAVTDAKLILDTLAGRDVPQAKALELVENFIGPERALTITTNEEKAQLFLDELKGAMRRRIRAGAANYWSINNADAQNTAIAASTVEFD